MTKSITATNQNRGATARITAKMTAKCTPQWASNGRNQAGLLILADRHPGCLQHKVGDDVLDSQKQPFHPINAPSGTDADMGETTSGSPSGREMTGRMFWRLQRNFFLLTPRQSVQGSLFMTSPDTDCTIGALEKHRVWPMDAPVRLPGAGYLQSSTVRISWLPVKLSFFFRYLGRHLGGFGAARAVRTAKVPQVVDMEP